MIAESLLNEVLDHVVARTGKSDEILIRDLRGTFSGLHFSVCSDDDMPSRMPFAAENSLCRLYYVKSGDHCLSLTTDADSATGLVVALVDPDD